MLVYNDNKLIPNIGITIWNKASFSLMEIRIKQILGLSGIENLIHVCQIQTLRLFPELVFFDF